MKRGPKPGPLVERFWGHVSKGDGCWVWTGECRGGYGRFRTVGRASVRAHRYAWALVNGPIPDGALVLHRCDNRPCVRPEHLFLGTAKDNAADRDMKGRARFRPCFGEANGQSKLTAAEVLEIKAALHRGEPTRHLADRFSVHRETVRNIRRGKSWAGVQPTKSTTEVSQ
jgi:hypothetical protein